MYLKMYIKSERFHHSQDFGNNNACCTDYDEVADDREGGGGARRCARDGPAAPPHPHPPAQPPPPPAHPAHPAIAVKTERLSPHDNTSTASRSRSVTPSTSSYPGTPPERGSPGAGAGCGPLSASAPAPPAPPAPPRNYSDIMRSLAARYNPHHNNDYFHRVNGSGCEPAARAVAGAGAARGAVEEAPLGGLFARLARLQGGPPRLPAFPVMFDMTSTKTLLAISRLNRGSRMSRRKRTPGGGNSGSAGGGGITEHCPLDLSAGGESAAKRARLSASPSLKSDCDERDRASNDDRLEVRGECACAEARARLAAWTVDDVCDFVTSIDICAEYAPKFREQRIDGSGLPLLTEEHLTGMLQMKLGPALKLRALLARKNTECPVCCPTKVNGALKSEPRSNTTSPS